MPIVNCTPHKITLTEEGKGSHHYEPSGVLPRVQVETKDLSHAYEGIPMVQTVTGEVEGLPEPAPGILYLCSTMVAQAAKRRDVIAPDTGPTAIRENGQVVAVRRFQTFYKDREAMTQLDRAFLGDMLQAMRISRD